MRNTMTEIKRCKDCNGIEGKCWCDMPGFVTYRGYTREQALASVGKGWAQMIHTLFDAKPKDTRVHQVKEKFGGLRFYVGGTTDMFHNLIDDMENASYTICETCGNSGSLRTERSWVKTLCDDCAKPETSI